HVHVELAREGGWLVGGPDPARVPGSRHDIDLRWIEGDATVPVSGSQERWSVRTAGEALEADEATPALPEVRVVLSAMSEALAGAAAGDPALGAAIAALRAI